MVLLAKNAGFCFGVKRAVDAVENNIEKSIVTLGYLIHNESVVRSLEARGVRCVSSLDEVNEGETVVIRSHGVSPAVYDALDARGIDYIDATCPFVKRIHKRVSEAKDAGLPVIIVGELGHPEVEGIIGWAADNAFVVYTDAEIEKLPHMKQAVVVAQTTISEEKWLSVLHMLEYKIDDMTSFSSICSATKERQDEAEEIAKKADVVIVVGGKFSSNTRKLYELCKRYCKKVYHIEHYRELLLEKMCFGGIIGIVAGASTPDTMIREVYDYMIENEKVLPTEGDESITQSEAANDTADLTVEETDAAMDEPAEASEQKKEENAGEDITTPATDEETNDEHAEDLEEAADKTTEEDIEVSAEETEETNEPAEDLEEAADKTTEEDIEVSAEEIEETNEPAEDLEEAA
ncbi:MAG: 4-hydroxy-3-methylbut-2-enyl diphosphate reductase, partial [Eubacteriales bacterium]|nr:4-hydroxy-3-methylbut-2-enyl diphosphate reductase [Eubacteriales bacterium]